jgi:heptosyltransferase-2
MHVAAALGRPLIAVYGSSSPGFTPPLSVQATIISLQDLDCSPCFQRDLPAGPSRLPEQARPAARSRRLPDSRRPGMIIIFATP